MLSIVIPVYGAPEQLQPLMAAINRHLSGLEKEVILIVDACPYGSWSALKSMNLPMYNTQFIALNLVKNIGQHKAIWLGLRHASGENIIVMDCDMQDDPRNIELLLNHLEGHEAVVASRSKRQDSFFKKLMSKIFWKYISVMTDLKFDGSVANFGAYRKSLVKRIIASEGSSPFFPIEVKNLATSMLQVPVNHNKRLTSKSSYTFKKLIALAVSATISFSKKPCTYILVAGIIILFMTLFAAICLVVLSIWGAFSVEGWASLFLLVSFWGSVQMVVLGVVGLYVLEIFDKTNDKKTTFIGERLKF